MFSDTHILSVDLPDDYYGYGYSLKYSDEGSKIGVSIPGIRVDVPKTDKMLPKEFRTALIENGFSVLAVLTLTDFLLSGKGFQNGSYTIDAETGVIYDDYKEFSDEE